MTDLTGIIEVVGYIVLGAGVLLFVVAALGLVRFPDVYSRRSAVTKAATLGLCHVLAGVFLVEPSWPTAIAVILAAVLQLITSPVGGYALGRAAYHSGAPLAPNARYDDLARDEADLDMKDGTDDR